MQMNSTLIKTSSKFGACIQMTSASKDVPTLICVASADAGQLSAGEFPRRDGPAFGFCVTNKNCILTNKIIY